MGREQPRERLIVQINLQIALSETLTDVPPGHSFYAIRVVLRKLIDGKTPFFHRESSLLNFTIEM